MSRFWWIRRAVGLALVAQAAALGEFAGWPTWSILLFTFMENMLAGCIWVLANPLRAAERLDQLSSVPPAIARLVASWREMRVSLRGQPAEGPPTAPASRKRHSSAGTSP
jgi:hypothetical protein